MDLSLATYYWKWNVEESVIKETPPGDTKYETKQKHHLNSPAFSFTGGKHNVS